MAAYDYECKACGAKFTRFNVQVDKRDDQKHGDATSPCDGELQRSEEISASAVQVDASGAGYMGVTSSGQYVKGQFGGGHMQKRRFKP